MADLKTRAGRIMRVHKPANEAIAGAKVGSPLATPIQNQDLMSHQDGFGNDGPKAAGASKPDEGHHRMQKKSENLAHARDGIKSKKLKNSMGLANSLPQVAPIPGRLTIGFSTR
jgi:hypothetical protein